MLGESVAHRAGTHATGSRCRLRSAARAAPCTPAGGAGNSRRCTAAATTAGGSRRLPIPLIATKRTSAMTPPRAAASPQAAGSEHSVSVSDLRATIWRALLAQGHTQTDAATLLDVRALGPVERERGCVPPLVGISRL